MTRAARIAVAHPIVVLLLVLGATVFSISRIVDLRTGEPRLLLDSSFDSLLPADSEGKRFYDTVVLELCERGHTVSLAVNRKDKRRALGLDEFARRVPDRRGGAGNGGRG